MRRSREVPKKMVAQVYDRADGRCENCGIAERLHVHHKKYRSRGGSHELVNLALLCLECHERTHDGDRELARFRTKRWQHEGENEEELDEGLR